MGLNIAIPDPELRRAVTGGTMRDWYAIGGWVAQAQAALDGLRQGPPASDYGKKYKR